MGKTGPVPLGCGENAAILLSRPRPWSRQSLRARSRLAAFSRATLSAPKLITDSSWRQAHPDSRIRLECVPMRYNVSDHVNRVARCLRFGFGCGRYSRLYLPGPSAEWTWTAKLKNGCGDFLGSNEHAVDFILVLPPPYCITGSPRCGFVLCDRNWVTLYKPSGVAPSGETNS